MNSTVLLSAVVVSMTPLAMTDQDASSTSPPISRAEGGPTPARVFVSDKVQTSYIGPGGYWTRTRALSDQELDTAERKLLADPQDLCTRGFIIASRKTAQTSAPPTQLDHVLWMIRNHPEWDGFSLEPAYSLTRRFALDRAAYARMNQAWSEQAAYSGLSALALHNAAMFFAITEPWTASKLLQRAIALEPGERFYVERLGLVYAYSQVGPEYLQKAGIEAAPERPAFAQQAHDQLLHSADWVLVRGAFNAALDCPGCTLDPAINSATEQLRERLRSLPAEHELPSLLMARTETTCGAKHQ